MPPTVKLANISFGERDTPIVIGWVVVGHQLGAATAAYGAGLTREQTGTYLPAFLVAGGFAIVAVFMFMTSAATPHRIAPRPLPAR